MIAHAVTASGGHHGHSSPRGDAHHSRHDAVADDAAVRRLTPRECERLQGFPDDWTLIPGASDSKRYKAIGNSVAVPVIEWIGRRLNKSTKSQLEGQNDVK